MTEQPETVYMTEPNHEHSKVVTQATVEKRDAQTYADAIAYARATGKDEAEARAWAQEKVVPLERIVGDSNAMVDAGIINALNALIGVGITAFNNANARLGVGDSSTAWGTTQTDLQAASNKLRKGMNTSYPTGTGTKTITFQADFVNGEAEWAWAEWGIFNAASGATSMLSRKVQSFGTKGAGATWTLTVTFTFA